MTTLKSLLTAAGTTIDRLDRKLGREGWAALTDGEKAAWTRYQEGRLAKGSKSWGRGRLVTTADGSPMAWFEIDNRIRGFEKYAI
jgi:hypothetical protein